MTDLIYITQLFLVLLGTSMALSYAIIYNIHKIILNRRKKMEKTRNLLIEEYKALLELQMEAVDIVVDIGDALEEAEAHLNAVGITVISV